MRQADEVERDLDLVRELLELVHRANPAITAEQLSQIEQEFRERFGGMRTRIAKRKKHPNTEQRARVFAQALTDAPTSEIVESNGISRATLYRYLKRGGR